MHAEIRSKRPVMNLAHAGFSVSVVVASLGTAGLRAAGARPPLVLGAVTVAIVAIAVFVLGRGTRNESSHDTVHLVPEAAPPRRGRTWRPAPPLIVFGCLCGLAYVVENAWQSWGAVHLATTLHASAGLSATAPAVFASAAAVGRFAGNSLVRCFNPVRLLSAGALTAGAGTLVAATAATPWIGLTGIAVAGLGTSVCAPTVIASPARGQDPRGRELQSRL